MPTAAYIALDWLDSHPAATKDQRRSALAAVPPSQFAGPHWGELSRHCEYRLALDVERRPGNALNLEVGTPMPRCTGRSPDGRGLAWLLSGGSALAYGICAKVKCPRASSTVPDGAA